MELHTTVTLDEQKSVARIALSGALNTDTAPGFDEELQGVVAKGLDLTVLDMKTRKDMFVPILIVGITLASNLAAGFLVGIAVAYALKSEKLSV